MLDVQRDLVKPLPEKVAHITREHGGADNRQQELHLLRPWWLGLQYKCRKWEDSGQDRDEALLLHYEPTTLAALGAHYTCCTRSPLHLLH